MACVDNIAYIAYADSRAQAVINYATADVAIATALALWKRTSSSTLADLQSDLGERQYRLAERVRNHAKKFWPYETAFLNDAFGEPYATPQYSSLALSWGGYVDNALTKGRTNFLTAMKQKCISVTDCEDNKWKRGQQLIKADIMSHADRHAEHRADTVNDRRFSRQYSALQLGRGYLGLVPSFQDLAGYSSLMPRGALFGTINRALQWWGSQRIGDDPWRQTADENYPNMPYPTYAAGNHIPNRIGMTVEESFSGPQAGSGFRIPDDYLVKNFGG